MATPPIRLVAAEPQHLPHLVPFVRAFYAHFNYAYEEHEKRELLLNFLGDPSAGRLWLIEIDGEPQGYVLIAFSFSLELGGRIAFVDELFIHPYGRQRGAGQAVLAQLDQACGPLGLKALRLETEANNSRARALYIRSGYHDLGRNLLTKAVPISSVQ